MRGVHLMHKRPTPVSGHGGGMCIDAVSVHPSTEFITRINIIRTAGYVSGSPLLDLPVSVINALTGQVLSGPKPCSFRAQLGFPFANSDKRIWRS
jgi:hypothetical protein